MKNSIDVVLVISDIHGGCQLALCPINGVRLDGGGFYKPNKLQRKIHYWWEEFLTEWVPEETKGKKFNLVFNGDLFEGRHHGSITQFTQNLSDQANVAYELCAPVVEKAENLYMLRGTESHTGKSAEQEEQLAEKLGAKPNTLGQYARDELWLKIGKALGHFTHHIGTSGSEYYQSTAPLKELITAYSTAGKMGKVDPNVVCRSHRHSFCEVRLAGKYDYDCTFCTPAWQLQTPYAYRSATVRNTPPQLGGSIIMFDQKKNSVYTKHFVKYLERPRIEG